jgi:DnaJ-domain-containing protein 1
VLLAFGLAGCVTRPPTIAHVHLGHALTGVHVTPGKSGYLIVAEERAEAIRELATTAASANDLSRIKPQVAAAVQATLSENQFGLKHSLVQASNHIAFAAASEDASENVRKFATQFANDIVRVVERCELIGLLGKDVAASTAADEARLLAAEIERLADQNLNGEDADKDGVVGGQPREFGMQQLRHELDTMIARERPAYRTVDQWYLFNLVKLPNGRWVFDKLARGGNVDGYK